MDFQAAVVVPVGLVIVFVGVTRPDDGLNDE